MARRCWVDVYNLRDRLGRLGGSMDRGDIFPYKKYQHTTSYPIFDTIIKLFKILNHPIFPQRFLLPKLPQGSIII